MNSEKKSFSTHRKHNFWTFAFLAGEDLWNWHGHGFSSAVVCSKGSYAFSEGGRGVRC
jgi:hypothetical protein